MKKFLFNTLIIALIIGIIIILPNNISAKDMKNIVYTAISDNFGIPLEIDNEQKADDMVVNKFDDGRYEYKLRIPDDLKDKNLLAFYITDENEVETYSVSKVDDYAVFQTDKFKLYYLADADNLSDYTNPKTGDDIAPYVIVSAICIFGTISIALYINKKVCG